MTRTEAGCRLALVCTIMLLTMEGYRRITPGRVETMIEDARREKEMK